MDISSHLFFVCVFVVLWQAVLVAGQSTVFTTQPGDSVVVPDSEVTLLCTAKTNLTGNLVILWKHNSTWIYDYQNKHYKQLINGSLYFIKFLSRDQGTYQCSAIVQDQSGTTIAQIYSRVAKVEHAYIKDRFTLSPESTSGKLGTKIQLQCVSPESYPLAKIYWQRNDQEISGYLNGSQQVGTSRLVTSTLEIGNLSLSTVGFYSCIAVNRFLQHKVTKSSVALVKIDAEQEPPYFVQRPTSLIAKRRSPLVWPCVILGVPVPVVTWYKNDQLIYNTTDRYVLGTGSLAFSSVSETDAGSYHCKGTNSLGSVGLPSPVALLVAFIDYAFKEDPVSATVSVASQVRFRCQPPNSYPAKVALFWYFQYDLVVYDDRIRFAADGTLVIANVKKSDEGVYFCVAENESTNERRSSRTATLTVQVTPAIEPLKNMTATIGTNVALTCQASGFPSPTVQWYKDNVLVSENGTFVIQRANISSVGWYTCKASNAAGTESSSLYLGVQSVPTLTTKTANLTKLTKDDVWLPCEFSGYPKPEIEWYVIRAGSTQRTKLSVVANVTEGGLYIASISKSDEGLYICSGSNSAGKADGKTYITVLVPPTILVSLRNITANETESVTFFCNISGDPLPKISWLKNGQILTASERLIMTSYSLSIHHLRSMDSGWYECNGTSSLGSVASSGHLAVQVGPSISTFIASNVTMAGVTLIFKCIALGLPPPRIKWIFNESKVIEDSTLKHDPGLLEIVDVSSKGMGLYECRAENLLGVDKRSVYLTVQVPPSPPDVAYIVPTSAVALEVFWITGFNGYSSILRHILEIRRGNSTSTWQVYDAHVPTEKTSYLVTGLEPFTVYEFRMASVNRVGTSDYSQVQGNSTLEDAPSVPLNLKATVLNATSVALTWQEPDRKHGRIVLYQILFGVSDMPGSTIVNVTVIERSSYSLVLTTLLPYRRYYFNVRAATGGNGVIKFGNVSQTIYATTPEAAPCGAPTILAAIARSSTSISLEFSTVDPEKANGIIEGYNVYYVATKTNDSSNLTTVNTQVTLVNLKKFTVYGVHVRAFTKVGIGPPSTGVHVRTKQDVPGQVFNVAVLAHGSDKINVSWLPPTEVNGILTGYMVKYTAESTNKSDTTEISENTTFATLYNLQSEIVYFVAVAAKTEAGVGLYSTPVRIQLGNGPLRSSATPVITSPNPAATTPTERPDLTEAPPKTTSQSTDLLSSKNLPIVLAILGGLFILLVSVLVLAVIVCRRRNGGKSTTIKDERDGHWINTPSFHGGENPAYRFDQFGFELNRTNFSEISTLDGHPSSPSTFDPGHIKPPLDEDLVWQDTDSDRYAVAHAEKQSIGETSVTAEECLDDKRSLVKLKSKEADLGEDASLYDKPYSSVRELGEPFAKDLLNFVDTDELHPSSNPYREPVLPYDGNYNSPSEPSLENLGVVIPERDLKYSPYRLPPKQELAETMSAAASAKAIPRIELPRGDIVPDQKFRAPKISIDPGQQTYNYEKGTVVVNEDAVVVFDEQTKL